MIANTDATHWVSMRGQPSRNFYHCHIDNTSFAVALKIFGARSTKFKATTGSPRSGRRFMLKLTTGRYAIVRNYDGFLRWTMKN